MGVTPVMQSWIDSIIVTVYELMSNFRNFFINSPGSIQYISAFVWNFATQQDSPPWKIEKISFT